MKRLNVLMSCMTVFLLVLVFTLGGCVEVVVNDATKADEPGTEKETESVATEPETAESDSAEESEPETETEAPKIELRPGLFKGHYTEKTYNNSGDSSLNLQADARFFKETNWSDGGGGNSVMGNYVVDGEKVYAYTWFNQAGDPAAYAAPDGVSVYEIVDEDTLSIVSETETVTYKRVTDQAEIDEFAEWHSIVQKLTNYEFVNDFGSPVVPTENPAKAVSVYEYHVTEGFLRDVELVFFENGRFYLSGFYDDGSAGSTVIGNYYFKDDSFWCLPWFAGGGDPSLTLCNGIADRYIVTKTGSLLTSAFQGSTDGADIVLEWNGSANLETYTRDCDINAMLKYMMLFND